MPLKRLSIVTFSLFLLIFIFGSYLNKKNLPDAIVVKFEDQPTIGYPKAKVHVVVFEEPKCVNCRDYTNKLYPQIKKNFIDTNKITYTVIPVSFLPGSMPAAVALLCVYNADAEFPNHDLFFKYLDYIYANQPDEHTDWVTTEKMVEFAKAASPAIELDKLAACIDKETYRVQVEKNNAYGRSIMKGQLSTPTIYINGIKVEGLDYSTVENLIHELLEKEGVN